MSTARDILLDIAAELRDHPESWCQYELAVDQDGHPLRTSDEGETDIYHPAAVAWCLAGHLLLREVDEENDLSIRTAWAVLHETVRQLTGGRLDHFVSYNDEPGRTVSDIIKLCELAAEYTEELE